MTKNIDSVITSNSRLQWEFCLLIVGLSLSEEYEIIGSLYKFVINLNYLHAAHKIIFIHQNLYIEAILSKPPNVDTTRKRVTNYI